MQHIALLIYPVLENKFRTHNLYERFSNWKIGICISWNRWIQFLVSENSNHYDRVLSFVCCKRLRTTGALQPQ